MVVFFLVAAALLLLVLLLIVPSLSGRGGDYEQQRDEHNIAIARERLAELDARHERGEPDQGNYERERLDIERALLDDLDRAGAAAAGAGPRGGPWTAIAVGVALPILAGALYLGLGRPEVLSGAPAAKVAQAPADGQHPVDMEAMVAQLAQRLAQDPDNAEGWAMLGRSYMAMSRYAEAADAFGRLYELVGEQPAVLVRYADAMAMSNGGSLAGKPRQLVERALALQPDNTQGLWMAGTAARQAADHQLALDYFRRLEPLVASQPDTQATIRQLIAEAEQQLGGAAAPAPGPAAGPAMAAAKSVTVEVNLDPSLSARVTPDDTVFIFARALQGPPMPLAVVRKRAGELPLTVTLDDSSAMAPALRLSNFDQVRVSARISKSGQAVAQSGDLQAEALPVSTLAGEPVTLSINQVVP